MQGLIDYFQRIIAIKLHEPQEDLGPVDLSSSFLQQFDWLLYKAEAAWHSYSM